MKRKCNNKCLINQECEYRKEYLYKYTYKKYKKLYNNDALKIKQIRQLELKCNELLREKEKSSNLYIDRTIAVVALIIGACAILTENEATNSILETMNPILRIIYLVLALIYIIYNSIKDRNNIKKSGKIVDEIKDINFKITIIKDLLYDEHKIII